MALFKRVVPWLLAALSVTCAHAQEPWVLSPEVQTFSKNIGLTDRAWVGHIKPASAKVSIYVDLMTSFDVMAKRRVSFQRRNAITEDDYRAVSSAICFLPNKPPAAPQLQSVIAQARAAAFGMYYAQTKRSKLALAMGFLLLEGSPEEIGKLLSNASTTPEVYRRQILDVPRLQ